MKSYNSKIGNQKFILSDVNSTNNFAAKLINDGLGGHGSVIMAENQTNGRGQQGSLWQSSSKLNLLVSLILSSTQLSKVNPISINWYISVCIIEFLKSKKINAKIKWPNDVLVDSLKISGILIENKFLGSNLKSSIAGVGINVNQLDFQRMPATSMKMQTGQDYSIDELLDHLIGYLNENEQLIYSEQNKKLKDKYLKDLFGLEDERIFSTHSKSFSGKIIGVDDAGRLLVESNGSVLSFQNKEVKFL
ncbi:MAG: biotin--[acetyl-CoA-carboxylase] ligase [Crocinitomicaceae bacterium]|jgi:BirA family transcriptional regulator, biotin operon repressor / biotin---[acetyl-CoA-carboxylase] ligase|nr:biotin--[acetyl-CoA-carboxylase] ligase [Crocinitomicaceae bacterium]